MILKLKTGKSGLHMNLSINLVMLSKHKSGRRLSDGTRSSSGGYTDWVGTGCGGGTHSLARPTVRQCLSQQMTSNCSFIHVPSFDPETCRTELLAAMIASIASTSANKVISQMGLALQEKARIALANAFFHDDRLTRTVQAMQTAILLRRRQGGIVGEEGGGRLCRSD